METRSLRIWDADVHSVEGVRISCQWRAEYHGPYSEHYEPPTAFMKAKTPEWRMVRIGLIRDAVKNRIAAFRQPVRCRNDCRPTDLAVGEGGLKAGESVLEAWSSDPEHADPPGRGVACTVLDFAEQEPRAKAAPRRTYGARKILARLGVALALGKLEGTPTRGQRLLRAVAILRKDKPGATDADRFRELVTVGLKSVKAGKPRPEWLTQQMWVAMSKAATSERVGKAAIDRWADSLRRAHGLASRKL